MDCAASIFQGRACLCALKKGKKRKENMKSAFKIQLGSNTEQLVPVVNKFFFFLPIKQTKYLNLVWRETAIVGHSV